MYSSLLIVIPRITTDFELLVLLFFVKIKNFFINVRKMFFEYQMFYQHSYIFNPYICNWNLSTKIKQQVKSFNNKS